MIKLNNMKKILGLDLGTNSIGWAVVDDNCFKTTNLYKLIVKALFRFPFGSLDKQGPYCDLMYSNIINHLIIYKWKK